MEDVILNDKHYTIPSSWDELNARQVTSIMQIIFKGNPDLENILDFRSNPDYKVLGYILTATFNINATDFSNLTEVQLFYFYDLLYWIFETPCTHPVIDKVFYKLRNYRLPQANFNNATFLEFVLCDTSFNNICKGNQINDNLDRLAAIMLRPNRLFKRKSVDNKSVEKRSNDFLKLPIEYKVFCFWYFWGIRQMIESTYPIFDKSEGKGSAIDKFGWYTQVKAVGDNGAMGTIDHAWNTDMHDVFVYLYKSKEEYAKQLEDLESLKTINKTNRRK